MELLIGLVVLGGLGLFILVKVSKQAGKGEQIEADAEETADAVERVEDARAEPRVTGWALVDKLRKRKHQP